mgnify:CR=1 FL=1|tara:strand:+ start:120 stop:290 length:171 start_codon:yes stop_codon:yes gene_type:complete
MKYLYKNEPSYIICNYIDRIKKYQIIDGLHRISILINKGFEKVKIYVSIITKIIIL